MPPRSLHAVLSRLADDGPPDAYLLRRYAAHRDEAAFAELVRRHGRLVWGVCRHLTRTDADADDAFQATFLALARHAPAVRDAGRLAAWLHAVACRVCKDARRAGRRRHARERVAAAAEGRAEVGEGAWERAAAAVHEEAARLPGPLRAAFVLCCLEGCGPAEAAERLGWKPGTLSGRLARAKAAVLAGMDARGLTAGLATAAVGVGAATAPAEVVAKAAALGRDGCAVPGSVLQLFRGAMGMGVHRVKVLAAGVLLACGVGAGAWCGWASRADAQVPLVVPPAGSAVDLPAASRDSSAPPGFGTPRPIAPPPAARWEYHYEPQKAAAGGGPTRAAFEAEVAAYEAKGWAFVGEVHLQADAAAAAGKSLPPQPTLVFRKPAGEVGPNAGSDAGGASGTFRGAGSPTARGSGSSTARGSDTRALPGGGLPTAFDPFTPPPVPGGVTNVGNADVVALLRKRVAELEDRLEKLATTRGDDVRPVAPPRELSVELPDDLSLEPDDLVATLRRMAVKKFGKEKGGALAMEYVAKTNTLVFSGDRAVAKWATGAAKELAGVK